MQRYTGQAVSDSACEVHLINRPRCQVTFDSPAAKVELGSHPSVNSTHGSQWFFFYTTIQREQLCFQLECSNT